MSRDNIIRMGEEADQYATSRTCALSDWRIIRDERFAALVAAHEREECAKVAEDDDYTVDQVPGYYAQLGDAQATARNIAAAIRARGNA